MDGDRDLRGAVLGLGMIGRHHARILQTTPGVEFAGAVDPGGDRFRAVHDPERLYTSLDDLLRGGAPDFAIVAVPTEEHVAAVERLAAEGVHVLVEKPLAASGDEAREVIAVVERAGIKGAVGHVERYNPALLAARDKLEQLGPLMLIATERTGPFPDRIKDVGVVKDLATHDLDLVRWLGSSPVEVVAAQTSHRMGRDHEDLVLATGRLASDVPFHCAVDWLTPTKTRRTRILGERGMLLADTLTGDLTFHENGEVQIEWAATQQLRGVSEGDAVRFALQRREPLVVEHEAFRAYVAGDDDAPVVPLEAGLETVLTAEAVLESARRGETMRLAPR
ncbi:MAG TPA: Gfo/Idh/MocA family oxidoreductase [Solirubrobacteraceae bacterium]|nr:Gfo/Idh/MocA family oxidoreductase [Solirubrobacteraceae bacterium]